MTWLDRQLAPFVEERHRQGWRGVAWALLLTLAPVAYCVAIVLGSRLPTAGVRYIKPTEMMARAEQTARERGVDVRGWRRLMTASVRAELNSYFDDPRFQRLPEEQRRFASYATARVVFLGPGKWAEVRLRSDGSLLGVRVSPEQEAPRTITEEEARQIATEELRRVLAPPASLGLRDAELLPGEGAGTRRFQWRAEFAGIPEFRGLFLVDVRGDRVTAVREEFSVDPVVVAARTPWWSKPLNGLRGILFVFFALYGTYLFARRSMEKEVAYSRCSVLFGGVIGLMLLIFVLNPAMALQSLDPERLTGGFMVTVLISGLLSVGIQAILLTMIYGGTEGEVREIYQDKLTSLDALLTGRWFSANVGRAVVIGVAVAGWALLAQMAGEQFFPSQILRVPANQISVTYTEHGWLTLLLNEPMVALFVCALTLLLPLTLANRWVADRRYRVWAVVALAVTSASLATDFESAHLWAVLKVAILAGLVLVAFWRGDFVSAVVAANLFVVGYAVALLAPLGADWPGVVRYVVMVAVMTGVMAVGVAYKGRELTEEEVRPKYAERLLERLGLQAEVSAAREAQLRLLPAEAPEAPGWKLSASCTPSKEVGGDFYDFFPLRNGGVGILVAEGGSTGLASALSIGLAKGFLLYASEKSWTAGEALRRLRPVLLRAVKGNIERLGLAYVTVDAGGAARVARFGVYPKIWELTAGVAPREIEPLGLAGEDFVGERSVKLGEQSLLLLVTDGLVERVREKTGLDLPAWIERRGVTGAAALQAALASEVGTDFDDDITMVLAERQAPALGLREGVA